MSIRHTVSNVLNRGRQPTGEMEAEREQIVHRMYVTLQKSCSKTDEPPKEKHVRNAICQTHEARNCTLFWQLAAKLPLAVNAITCWKFAYLLHKLLREGHNSMLKQSRAYTSRVDELSRYWSHIHGYGPLILSYMKLLSLKIEFHNKYEFLPGNLIPPENIEEKVGRSPDPQFEFVLDSLDYLEQLMETQKAVFRTMDKSRNSTSSSSGHNRLCACIPIIADSQELYSFCVKFLSLLHSQIPSEPLSGFRTRFLQIYKELKTFYEQCVTLQYIRQMTQVPKLPDNPPDFHSTIPEVNFHHETLQRANEIEQRPPSPETTIDSMSLIDVDTDDIHGLNDLQDDHFQIHGHLERVESELEALKYQLASTKTEQTIEVTKLLEYISQLEQEKQKQSPVDPIQIQSLQNELKIAQNEKSELLQKNGAVGSAFEQLKSKHVKLVQIHADLLRSSASSKTDAENLKLEKERVVSKFHGFLNFLRGQLMKEIKSEKSILGTKSASDRGRDFAVKLEQIEPSPESYLYNLSYVCLTAINLCSETAKVDGNLLEPATNLLESVELLLVESTNDPKSFDLEKIRGHLQVLLEELRKLNDDVVNDEEIGNALASELNEAAKLVEESALRIAAMLEDARTRLTGTELAVHEAILDSCTNLMDLIRQLIITSNLIQKQIVESGRGCGSASDFYCRNSRWTEGLLSASKAVGLRAQTLTDLADLCVQGQGNFDELIVASREIAASTAQLMAASRVKAARDDNLTKLESLSKQVNKAAGQVVGASQSGKTSKDSTESIDLTKLTYTQAKKVEMDSQVKILDLEYRLERERAKVREIRRSAYAEANKENPVANYIRSSPQKSQAQVAKELAAVLQTAPTPPTSTPLSMMSPVAAPRNPPVAAPRRTLSETDDLMTLN